MKQLHIPENELIFTHIRTPGPGGQNVNKVSTAIQLRFNVKASRSLPDEVKERLCAQLGKRLTQTGDLIIKAFRYRTQYQNRQDAIHRLNTLIHKAQVVPKKRKKTKPSFGVIQKRLETKKKHSAKKSQRRRIDD